jgi:hypothetical protein
MAMPRQLAKHLDSVEVEMVSNWCLQDVAGIQWLEKAIEAVLLKKADIIYEYFVKKCLAYMAHRFRRIASRLAEYDRNIECDDIPIENAYIIARIAFCSNPQLLLKKHLDVFIISILFLVSKMHNLNVKFQNIIDM